ncbi:uncharacterized protein VTP21DRAFT_2394 [Calcarisporiella thermophila]|uniref:uncharacterized protein n=1 Tax=Calcarisporiella thermophila TaxID=911321 RepID=UPI003742FB5F
MTAAVTIGELFEEWLESMENLPDEIQQNMLELRHMDQEFHDIHDRYKQLCKDYYKQVKKIGDVDSQQQIATQLDLEKEYREAMRKQDQKIELANKVYDIVSRHIERIDEQITKHGYSLDYDPKEARDKRGGSPSVVNSPRKRGGGGGVVSMSEMDIDPNEPLYCYCNQVSFGDMVACDNDQCEREWFHYGCVGLTEPPKGKWFCSIECKRQAS